MKCFDHRTILFAELRSINCNTKLVLCTQGEQMKVAAGGSMPTNVLLQDTHCVCHVSITLAC